MAPARETPSNNGIAARITAVRDKWHTKQHPMFRALASGELDLRVLGIYMAQHAKYVRYGLEAFGLLYARGPSDVRKMLVENMAEEEGLIGGHSEHGAHDHMQMIYDFCAVTGMTEDEVMNVGMTPAWWGRALYYLNVARVEPLGVVLAMQFTQEGQMPALNGEVVLPALDEHYGHKRTDRAVVFFAEHELADQDHSRRQLELASKYLDTPELQQRAAEVAEEMCRLRWGCTTDTYRIEHLKEQDELPPGVEL
jgi:pyrroloquinoline quinone (PQQ) biosynthesis protein C